MAQLDGDQPCGAKACSSSIRQQFLEAMTSPGFPFWGGSGSLALAGTSATGCTNIGACAPSPFPAATPGMATPGFVSFTPGSSGGGGTTPAAWTVAAALPEPPACDVPRPDFWQASSASFPATPAHEAYVEESPAGGGGLFGGGGAGMAAPKVGSDVHH